MLKEYIADEMRKEQGDEQELSTEDILIDVFNDPIHGHIELPPLCIKIVDTPQFQRLRNIKQLGTCYLVYPGASHNRFEHSLGVCHLAGKLLRAINERQPNIITEKDKLCVLVAALCHDLGQGPFSVLFEKKFIPVMHQQRQWKHEEASVEMFDYMLSINNGSLLELFKRSMEGFEEKDITFIKEMMNPKVVREGDEWPYKGRSKEKGFLYQIVLNKLTGIDVDRWDYLTRDCYMLGMKNIFDHNRCISVARVIKADDESTHICFRDKEAQDVYDMFYTRMTLYRRAYQHKTSNIIGRMVCDALQAASDHLTFQGKNGREVCLADTINDMEAFSNVTDDVLYTILQSKNKKLESSRDLVKDIMNRKLYKCVGQTQIRTNGASVLNEADFKEDLMRKMQQKQDYNAMFADHVVIDMVMKSMERSGEVKEMIVESDNRDKNGKLICIPITINRSETKQDIGIKIQKVVKLNYGLEDKDPIKHVKFYSKFDEDKLLTISKEQVSYVLPETFSEQIVRVYCKSSSAREKEIVKDSFSEWCEDKGYPKPKDR